MIVHGAWGGGWDWRAVDSLLTLRGHRAVRVTLTGQGVRDGMSIPPWVSDTLAIPRDVPHSVRAFTDTLRLVSPAHRRPPGTYILTVEPDRLPDAFQQFADRAAARGWPVYTIQSDHNAQRTARGPLVELLDAVP